MEVRNSGERGIVLYMVLLAIFIALLLGASVLGIMSSHTRLTHHQVSRIQAYYVAKAGMVYTLEALRTNAWTVSSCPPPAGCDVDDPTFPPSVINPNTGASGFNVIIRAPGAVGCTYPGSTPAGAACINIKADYTFTP